MHFQKFFDELIIKMLKLSKTKNFGIFEISSSKILMNMHCPNQISQKKKMNHPTGN